jgi:hypothetical protein
VSKTQSKRAAAGPKKIKKAAAGRQQKEEPFCFPGSSGWRQQRLAAGLPVKSRGSLRDLLKANIRAFDREVRELSNGFANGGTHDERILSLQRAAQAEAFRQLLAVAGPAIDSASRCNCVPASAAGRKSK